MEHRKPPACTHIDYLFTYIFTNEQKNLVLGTIFSEVGGFDVSQENMNIDIAATQ